MKCSYTKNSLYNTKIKDIRDNIGIGKKFPAPLGTVCNSFIGTLSPYDINIDDVRDQKLRKVMKNVKMEDNPILVIYK